MTVELVAVRSSKSASASNFPALVKQDTGGLVRCDDSIPGNYHCLVSLVEGELVVWDLGTPGGTFVNGVRVTKGTVKSGDRLSLGGTTFQVDNRQRPRRYLLGLRA